MAPCSAHPTYTHPALSPSLHSEGVVSRGTAILGVDRIALWPPRRAAAPAAPTPFCGRVRGRLQSQKYFNGILMVYEYCTGTLMVMVHTLKYPRAPCHHRVPQVPPTRAE